MKYDDEKKDKEMANFHMGEEVAYNVVAMLIEENDYAKELTALYKTELEGSEAK